MNCTLVRSFFSQYTCVSLRIPNALKYFFTVALILFIHWMWQSLRWVYLELTGNGFGEHLFISKLTQYHVSDYLILHTNLLISTILPHMCCGVNKLLHVFKVTSAVHTILCKHTNCCIGSNTPNCICTHIQIL